MKRIWYFSSIILVFLACSQTNMSKNELFKKAGLNPVAQTADLPVFDLKNLPGQVISSESLKGKYTFINFWATWCAPCRSEMPGMETAFKSGKINIVAISSGEEIPTVKEFVDSFKYTFPIFLDEDSSITAKFGIGAFPTTYLVNPKGQIIAGREGAFDWTNEHLSELLENLAKDNS